MKTNNLKIKDWAPDDRPREKLIQKGISTLSDAELIAILLGSGSRDESAVELAKKVLQETDNDLNQLAKLDITGLQNFKGIGEAKAINIIAALELGKRRKLSEVKDRKQILSSKDVFEYFQPVLCDLPHEEFWILLLNQSNKIIRAIKISQGGISGTVTDTRIIVRYALEHFASSLILCHNHPSGNKNPSQADNNITLKIKEAANFFDIGMPDHLIICEKDYFSYADEGII